MDKLEEGTPSDGDEAPKKKSALRENIEVFIVAALLALFIRTFIVQAFKIPSGSMKETLQQMTRTAISGRQLMETYMLPEALHGIRAAHGIFHPTQYGIMPSEPMALIPRLIQ